MKSKRVLIPQRSILWNVRLEEKCLTSPEKYIWNLLLFRKSSIFETILLWWRISIFWKRSIFWNVFSRNWKFPILSVGFLLVSAVDYQNFYNSSIKNRVVWQGYFFLQINCNEKDMVLFNWDIFGLKENIKLVSYFSPTVGDMKKRPIL